MTHARGARVIIGRRDPARLQAVARDCNGMEVELIDVADVRSIAACAERIAARHPSSTWSSTTRASSS